MDTTTITTAQIEALRDEAAVAGDLATVRVCRRALAGKRADLECVAEIIADAAAMDDFIDQQIAD